MKIKQSIFKTVRAKFPTGDGYSVVVQPCQSFKIHILYDRNKCLDVDSCAILDSEFLVLDKRYIVSKDGIPDELVFEFKQKYNLVKLARFSAAFLGEVYVRYGDKEYIRVGVYLDSWAVNKDILTVFNPKNHIVKIRPNTLLHVVMYGRYDKYDSEFNINKSEKTDFVLHTTQNPVIIPDDILPFIDINECKRFWFYTEKKQAITTNYATSYRLGTIVLRGSDLEQGLYEMQDVSFLNLWLSLRNTKKMPCMLAYSTWDKENQILLNPNHLAEITLHDPKLSLELEIIEPRALYPEEINEDISWRLEDLKTVRNCDKAFIINELPTDKAKIDDKEYKVYRFRIIADPSGTIQYNFLYGSFCLTCSNKSIVYNRKISINLAPAEKPNIQKKYIDGYYGKGNYGKHGSYDSYQAPYIATVDIDKLNGGITEGTDVKSVWTKENWNNWWPQDDGSKKKNGQNLPIVANHGSIVNQVGSKTSSPECSDSEIVTLINPRNIERVNLRKDSKLVIKMEVEKDSLDNFMLWSCNIFQNKTYLLNPTAEFVEEGNKLFQVFEFIIYNTYLPIVNDMFYFLAGIKLSRNSKSNKFHYICVYLTHNSLYDENIKFDKNYVAVNFIERLIENKKVSSPVVTRDPQKIGIARWKHNAGIIINPMKITDIRLPSLPSDGKKIGFTGSGWQVKFLQYSLPGYICQEFTLADDLDKFCPWWEDKSWPISAYGGITLDPILSYQSLCFSIIEKYYEHTKNLTMPIGELTFASGIIEQNREYEGTLIRSRQRYVKKIYLYVCLFNDQLKCMTDLGVNNSDYVEFKPALDCQSIVVDHEKFLVIHIDDIGASLLMMPYWMRLTGVFLETNKKIFVFKQSKKDIAAFNNDESHHNEGWIVFDSKSDVKRIKVSLEP